MPAFNILAVVQSGRLTYEAVLLAASLRAMSPGFKGRLYLAEPQPGPRWQGDPRLPQGPARDLLQELGAVFLPFENRVFGQHYPQGNKIEALLALPDEPFLFLDTDTLICGPLDQIAFDFARPSASIRVEGTWPQPDLYGPGYGGIWKALYDRFGLNFASSLDLTQPDEYWRRYLYFNAGWFFHQNPKAFGTRYLDYAQSIQNDPPDELACQELHPWLDQIALPLVIHSFGGGRPGPEISALDGDVTCHWRTLPLLYARESDRVIRVLHQVTSPNRIKKVLREYDAFKRMIWQGKGAEVRALFDQNALPRREWIIRNRIKRADLWMR